ncbi:MAG: serine hydrolase [Bacteroidales bacterium]|nr:serine hydrolase [Bacteroidales bacterium]
MIFALSLFLLPMLLLAQSPGGVVLLKNEGGRVPIKGQPKIALVQFGDGDLSDLEAGLNRNFLEVDLYLFGDLYSAENLSLLKTLGLYDRLLVVVLPGGEGDAGEIEDLLRKRPATLILTEGVAQTKAMRRAVSLATCLVYAEDSSKETLGKMAGLLSGERAFEDVATKDLSILFKKGYGLKTTKIRLGYAAPDEVGLDGTVLQKIDAIAEEGLGAGAYPGAQVLVAKGGFIVYEKAFGYKDASGQEPNDLSTLYDLASVTKAASADALVMMAVSQGLLSPEDKASKYLDYLRDSDKENLRLRQFLFHAAGLPAVIQFYKEILIDPNSYDDPLIRRGRSADHPVQIAARDFARNDWSYRKRFVRRDSSELFPIRMAEGYYLSPKVRPAMRKEIRGATLSRGYRYSDIDYLIIQDVLEGVYGESLDALFSRKFARPLGLQRLLYRPLRRYTRSEIAEGTRELFLRKQTLRGDVDDEAAAMLGGVSGNAGLFGNARDLAVLAQMYANGGVYGGLRFIDEAVLRRFTTARDDVSPYAMGFDRHRGRGKPGNTADEAPLSTYGHTGFTGTCFWVDPDNDIVYVFLSNRGTPTRWNPKLSQMDIRTRIQSVIYEALKK